MRETETRKRETIKIVRKEKLKNNNKERKEEKSPPPISASINIAPISTPTLKKKKKSHNRDITRKQMY